MLAHSQYEHSSLVESCTAHANSCWPAQTLPCSWSIKALTQSNEASS